MDGLRDSGVGDNAGEGKSVDARIVLAAFIGIIIVGVLAYNMGLGGGAESSPTTTLTTIASPGKNIVGVGDTVMLNYVGMFENGTVFDTSYSDIALSSGIYLPSRSYGPIKVVVGYGDLIEGVDEALVGMSVGQTREVTIPPEKAYGEKLQELVQAVPRVQSAPRFQEIDMESFIIEFGKEPAVGDIVYGPGDDMDSNPWPLEVVNVSGGMVGVFFNEIENATTMTVFGPANVLFNETHALVDIVPVRGRFMTMLGYVEVLDFTEDEILVDFNMELAGETLKFRLKVEEIL